MLTQIEIDGFKTFKDFKVELAPFQVIVGANGSGKSNLFDALQLLSRIIQETLIAAFQEMRGDPGELFTKLSDDKTVDRIRLAVELLVNQDVRDDFGSQVTLKYRRLRYELEITLARDVYGLDRFYLSHESLKSIPQDQDAWARKYGLLTQNSVLGEGDVEQAVFIDTEPRSMSIVKTGGRVLEEYHIHLYPDDNEREKVKTYLVGEVQRTVLSRAIDAEHAHAFAALEELRSLKFLKLNPEALRQPSSTKAPRFLSAEGHNLTATLARIEAEDKTAFNLISLDIANLVSGILSIEVELDKPGDRYLLHTKMADKRSFSSQVLSDGTLRLLALATLRNDPQFHGILCIEEPENGVQPLYLSRIAKLLREMATDLNDLAQMKEPLRQVIITTHSPLFISQPEVIDSLLLATTPVHIQGKTTFPMTVTRMTPVIMPDSVRLPDTENDSDRAMEAYTIDMVRKYLDSDIIDEAQAQLNQARANLWER